jgi:hypothetical protein
MPTPKELRVQAKDCLELARNATDTTVVWLISSCGGVDEELASYVVEPVKISRGERADFSAEPAKRRAVEPLIRRKRLMSKANWTASPSPPDYEAVFKIAPGISRCTPAAGIFLEALSQFAESAGSSLNRL